MTLVAVTELVDYMGGFRLSDSRAAHVAAVILPGVQGELETYLNRTVESIHVRERLGASPDGYLYFSHTPVSEIIRVVRSDGTVVATPPITPPVALVPHAGVERHVDLAAANAADTFRLKVLPGPQIDASLNPVADSSYVAEYISGFVGYLREALVLDIMRVAAREVDGQFDESMTLRGSSTEAASRPDQRPKGWTDDELAKWDRFRRRVVV